MPRLFAGRSPSCSIPRKRKLPKPRNKRQILINALASAQSGRGKGGETTLPCLSDQQRSGSNQIRQSSALIGVENGVNLLQGLEDSVSQSDLTLDAKLPSLAGFGGIKNIARDSVREGPPRS